MNSIPDKKAIDETKGAATKRWERAPSPGHGEVVVHVENSKKCTSQGLQSQGPQPPSSSGSLTTGTEISGEIVSIGIGVKRWEVGDKVYTHTVFNPVSEFVVISENQAVPITAGLTMLRNALLP